MALRNANCFQWDDCLSFTRHTTKSWRSSRLLQSTGTSRSTNIDYNLTELRTILQSCDSFVCFIKRRVCLMNSWNDLMLAGELHGALELFKRSHCASSEFDIFQDLAHAECMWLAGRPNTTQPDLGTSQHIRRPDTHCPYTATRAPCLSTLSSCVVTFPPAESMTASNVGRSLGRRAANFLGQSSSL